MVTAGAEAIQITATAATQIRKLMAHRGMSQGGLRVGVKAGGCSGLSYFFAWEEAPRSGDEVFEGPQGSRIFVDRKSHAVLKGTVLDFNTNLVGRGFVLNNPNAKSSCGCGVSFSV
jgi:iron-sulfur cluster assembly protein